MLADSRRSIARQPARLTESGAGQPDFPTPEAIKRAVPLAAQVAALVKSASESDNWQQGRYTGMRIAKFQNWLYEQNRLWRFTDGTLCVLWVVEFPAARAAYIAGWDDYLPKVRREYNAGRHQASVPAAPSVPFRMDGTPQV